MAKNLNRPSNDNSDIEYGERPMAFHPYNILMTLVLMGVTMLFIAFSAAYIYTRYQSNVPTIEVPNIFIFNTFVLIASSLSIRWANQCYLDDNTKKYQQALLLTIALTCIFMVLQMIGWQDLVHQEIFLATSNMSSYLYLISGLHFMHVIAGLPFLILFFRAARKNMREPVSVLVYFSDPEKRLKLKLLTFYWHFLDALWIYLILFFLINRMF